MRTRAGHKSSHESTEREVGEAVEQAFALAKARQPGKAVDVLKSCLERIDPLSWTLYDTLGEKSPRSVSSRRTRA